MFRVRNVPSSPDGERVKKDLPSFRVMYSARPPKESTRRMLPRERGAIHARWQSFLAAKRAATRRNSHEDAIYRRRCRVYVIGDAEGVKNPPPTFSRRMRRPKWEKSRAGRCSPRSELFRAIWQADGIRVRAHKPRYLSPTLHGSHRSSRVIGGSPLRVASEELKALLAETSALMHNGSAWQVTSDAYDTRAAIPSSLWHWYVPPAHRPGDTRMKAAG